MKNIHENSDGFWAEYSKRDLSEGSLMNLETDESLSREKFKAEKEHFNRVITIDKGDIVVDLGGGVGLWSEYFSQYAQEVVLVEKQKSFVEVAKKRLSEMRVDNVSVIEGDVVNYRAEPESVDKIFISGVTIYLEDEALSALANKIRNALKKGGILIHRDSYGRDGRYLIDAKFSEKLGMNYSAIYRSLDEYDSAFCTQAGMRKIYDRDMYDEGSRFNKWKETRIRFAVYQKEA